MTVPDVSRSDQPARTTSGTALAEVKRRAVLGLIGGAGAALAASAMVAFAVASQTPLWLIPFATSIVLVMSAPESPQAQPRNIVGGHLASCIAGYLALWLIGDGTLAAGIAVGIAVLIMTLTRTLHPPAGIDGLLVVTGHLPLSYMLMPVGAGALALVGFALVFHRATGRAWPATWW